jgi:hypothetical protein
MNELSNGIFGGEGIGRIDVRGAQFGTELRKSLSSQMDRAAQDDGTHQS